MANVKKVNDLLTAYFSEQFDSETLETARITSGLYTSWAAAAKEIKIEAASDHSRIRDFDRGVLLIEAEHPGWVQLLQTKQDQLLKLFQKKFPELKIQGVSFCLSRTPISRPPESGGSAAAPVTGTSAVRRGAGGDEVEPAAATKKPDSGNEAGPEKTAGKSVYESMKKFEKIIKKRNKDNPETAT